MGICHDINLYGGTELLLGSKLSLSMACLKFTYVQIIFFHFYFSCFLGSDPCKNVFRSMIVSFPPVNHRPHHYTRHFQHCGQGGAKPCQNHQGVHFIRVNNPTLNRSMGKYNLQHIWDGMLFNTPELRIKNQQEHQ